MDSKSKIARLAYPCVQIQYHQEPPNATMFIDIFYLELCKIASPY
jgi:hypothetical protein